MSGYSMEDYVDVAQRLQDFREAFPQGSLRPLNPDKPYDVLTIGDKTFIVYAAAAYRTPDDAAPGVGIAYEPFPGKSNFTRDSELQNAETSAWGRAIIAVLASTSKKIASAQEVRNREADRTQQAPIEQVARETALQRDIRQAAAKLGIHTWNDVAADFATRNPGLTMRDADEDALLQFLADLKDEYARKGQASAGQVNPA